MVRDADKDKIRIGLDRIISQELFIIGLFVKTKVEVYQRMASQETILRSAQVLKQEAEEIGLQRKILLNM